MALDPNKILEAVAGTSNGAIQSIALALMLERHGVIEKGTKRATSRL